MSAADKNIEIPDFSLVVLIGSTGSGKSTFAAKHFLPTEVISSDNCRALISDDETDQGVTADAFDLVRDRMEAAAAEAVPDDPVVDIGLPHCEGTAV